MPHKAGRGRAYQAEGRRGLSTFCACRARLGLHTGIRYIRYGIATALFTGEREAVFWSTERMTERNAPSARATPCKKIAVMRETRALTCLTEPPARYELHMRIAIRVSRASGSAHTLG